MFDITKFQRCAKEQHHVFFNPVLKSECYTHSVTIPPLGLYKPKNPQKDARKVKYLSTVLILFCSHNNATLAYLKSYLHFVLHDTGPKNIQNVLSIEDLI